MRTGFVPIRPRMIVHAFAFIFIASASLITHGLAAEPAAAPAGVSFNLILPFKDLTVGQ